MVVCGNVSRSRHSNSKSRLDFSAGSPKHSGMSSRPPAMVLILFLTSLSFLRRPGQETKCVAQVAVLRIKAFVWRTHEVPR